MGLLRATAFVGGTGLLALWLVSAVPTGAPAPPAGDVPAVRASPDARLFDFDGQRRRLRSATDGPRRALAARNPFEFDLRRHAAPDVVPPRAPAPPAAVPDAGTGSANPATPSLALVGMAERQTPDGVERVAILSGPDDVFLAARGERIAGRFVVETIAADAVELLDEADGRRIRLRLGS